MKLSLQEIHFIDNYLKKAEVIYIDIRSEMIDHIASAVEEKMDNESLDFYEAFRQYMIVNKKELLKNKGSWSIYSKTVIIAFFKFMLHPVRLIAAVLLYAFFKSTDVNQYFSEDFTISNLYFLILLATAIGQFVYFRLILKKRFFVLERLGGLLVLIYYGQIFFMNQFSRDEPQVYTLAISFYLLMVYLWYFVNEIRKFEQQKNLFV